MYSYINISYALFCGLCEFICLFILFLKVFLDILGLFDTIGAGKEESVNFFNNWVEHVKQTVPQERLLVFEAKQGWEPLCKFLNLPIPECSFPYVNDTSSMVWKLKALRIVSFTTVYLIPTILTIVAYLMLS